MHHAQANNPLHGITLETMLTHLVEHLGWKEMGRSIDIRCFNYDPSIKSSLQFLRRTPWARAKVEALYLTRAAQAQPKGSAVPTDPRGMQLRLPPLGRSGLTPDMQENPSGINPDLPSDRVTLFREAP